MKVTFIYPDFSIGAGGKFYHGIAFLSSALKQAGHKTSLIHCIKPLEKENFLTQYEPEKPDIIAISSTTNTIAYSKDVISWLRTVTKKPIICGGIHASLDPEGTIKINGLDGIVVGEGDKVIVDICNLLEKGEDPSTVGSVWWKKSGTIVRNSVLPLIEDLDAFPYPDRELFDENQLEDTRLKRGTFMASRGCPFNCSFCCNHTLRAMYPNSKRYVRFRSVNNLITEMEEVLSTRPYIESISLHDDILNLNRDWFRDFVSEYRKRIGLPFSSNTHPTLLNMEMAELLKKANCTNLSIGVESGNDYIRKEVLNRKMSDQRIKDAIICARRAGLRTSSFNMVGLPFEDMKKVLDTVKLNAFCKPSGSQVSIFYPYIGTTLYQVCSENKFLTKKELSSYFQDTVLSLPSISRKQILFAFHYFQILIRIYRFVYMFPKPISNIPVYILDTIVGSRFIVFLPLNTLYPFVRFIFFPIATSKEIIRNKLPKLHSVLRGGNRKRED